LPPRRDGLLVHEPRHQGSDRGTQLHLAATVARAVASQAGTVFRMAQEPLQRVGHGDRVARCDEAPRLAVADNLRYEIAVATTGTPTAIASSMTFGMPSRSPSGLIVQAIAKTSAPAYS